MKKSILVFLMIAALAAALLAGCGNQQPAPAPAPEQVTEAPTTPAPTETQAVTEAPTTQAAQPAPAPAPANNGGAITDQKALEIAYQHAGVAASDATRVDCHLDYDEDYGKQIFDIEFHVGNMEYNYDIDPDTGNVLEYGSEFDD